MISYCRGGACCDDDQPIRLSSAAAAGAVRVAIVLCSAPGQIMIYIKIAVVLLL